MNGVVCLDVAFLAQAGTMSEILLIDDEPVTIGFFETTLRKAGYSVTTASSGAQGLDLLTRRGTSIEAVITNLRLPDMSCVDILREIHRRRSQIRVVIVTVLGDAKNAAPALRRGAAGFIEAAAPEDKLIQTVERALTVSCDDKRTHDLRDNRNDLEAHAAARWARAVVPVIESPKDPRTISQWGHWISASPGALRNWCHTAGLAPRRSLVFARMLRAVSQGKGGQHKPENLLDIVDRRSLANLLKLAGFNPGDVFPRDIDEFLDRQELVRDPDVLLEIGRAMLERGESDRGH